MSFPRPHAPILGHPVVARVGRVARNALNPVEDHILFHPTDEIDGALLAAALPVGKVDARLVIDDEDALALRDTLPQALGLDPLERAHVVLVQALGRRQMPQRVRAQV